MKKKSLTTKYNVLTTKYNVLTTKYNVLPEQNCIKLLHICYISNLDAKAPGLSLVEKLSNLLRNCEILN